MTVNPGKFAGMAFLPCLQFFVAERISAMNYSRNYSYFLNYISDLGAVECALSQNLCSPLHGFMNASFVLQGWLIIGGALLCWSLWPANSRARYALVSLIIGGIGLILVALAPEDVAPSMHYTVAGVHLIGCNLAMVLFATASKRPPLPRLLFLAAGFLGFAGIVGSVLHVNLGLGPGGMERIAAYPFVLMLAASGVALIISASPPERRPACPEA